MDKFVARLNIENFRKKLEMETDDTKRRTVAALLAEEEAKLAAIQAREREDKKTAPSPPSAILASASDRPRSAF